MFISTFTVSTVSVFSAFSGGIGYDWSPYQIANKQDLEELKDSVEKLQSWSKNRYFILTADITDSVRTVIGIVHTPDIIFPNCFQGNFDGQNFTITVAININSSDSGTGLFRVLYEAKISNLHIVGYINNTNGSYSTGSIAGIIISNTTIINCHNNAKIKGNDNAVSGIVGIAINSNIVNCINGGVIQGKMMVGGIIGLFEGEGNSNITGCLNIASIEGNILVGGIIGTMATDNNPNVTVSACINNGFIKGNDMVGGIIGTTSGISTVKDCYNSNVVSGNSNRGCIIDLNMFGTTTVINCHYDEQMCHEK
jgi:hypothetical protein